MKKIVFMGTPGFSVPILRALIQTYQVVLVVTQPDRPKGRKRTLTPSKVKETAIEHDIPVYQPERVKTDYQHILDFEPDLIVTAAYGQILPVALLDKPAYGCINVHASLLPELRGGAPIHHAIIQGKQETGVTIMYMAEKMDAGDILSQKSVEITQDDNVATLHDKLSEVGVDALMEVLPSVFDGSVEPVEQDENAATFAPNISSEKTKINWQQDHVTVYNHIRGMSPWPVAHTMYQGKSMKIWRAEIDETHVNGEPGEIVSVQADGFTVACGDHKGIRVLDLQLAGKKRMAAGDFLRGMTETIIGEKLGD